jgi:hypothetical protein
MIIHQTTNKNYIIFAVDFLTVKHMIVNIAIKNIPGAASVWLPATALFPRRDTVTLSAPPKRLGGHGTLARPG